MTVKRQPSPYHDTRHLLAQSPQHYGHHLSDLDALGDMVMAFDKQRPRRISPDEPLPPRPRPTNTTATRVALKNQLVNIIDQFATAAPTMLRRLELQGFAGSLTDGPGGDIGQLLDKLALAAGETKEPGQGSPRSPEEKAAAAVERKKISYQTVNNIAAAIRERRTLLQPKRPRIDPDRQDVLEDLSFEMYAPFARALAKSAEKDRGLSTTARELERLPHLNQVAKETQAFVAMLDFSSAVKRVIEQTRNTPPGHWDPYYNIELQRAHDTFTAAIKPLELTVTAGDPTLRTSRAYDACIQAEKLILNADSVGALKQAHRQLKHHAFEFISGGADKSRDEAHHKLFTRIRHAYSLDRKKIAQDAALYETQTKRAVEHDRTHVKPFNNPLEAGGLHVLNRVYEARWALAADKIVDIVGRYRETLGNPEIPSTALADRAAALTETKPSVEDVRRNLAAVRNSIAARLTVPVDYRTKAQDKPADKPAGR